MKISIEELKRPSKTANKTVPINLKITKEVSTWLKDNGISPTLLFDRTVEELMKEQGSNSNGN